MTFDQWLESHDQRRTVLLEIDYQHRGDAGTLYLSNRPFVSFPGDTPSNTPYDDVILSGMEYTRSINGAAGGEFQAQVSSVSLAATPEIVAAREYEFANGEVRVYLGDERWERNRFELIAKLRAEALTEASFHSYVLQMRTAAVDIDQPIVNSTIGEGNFADRVKPLVLGTVLNVQPIQADADGLSWVLTEGTLSTVSEVRDNDQPTSFTLDAVNGKITLSSAPSGTLTCDAEGESGTSLRSVIRWLLDRLNVTARDEAAIDTLPDITVGLFSSTSITYRQAFDQLLSSVGAFWGFTRLGVFTVGVVELPLGSPSYMLTPDDIAFDGVRFVRRLTPAREVSLLYDRNWTSQDTRPEPGQTVRIDNNSIVGLYPDAEIREAGTLIRGKANAQSEASRRSLLFSAPHRIYTIRSFGVPYAFNLGDVVEVFYPYFGMKGGVLATVLKISDSPLNGSTEVEVLINGI